MLIRNDLRQQYTFVGLPNFIQVRKCPDDVNGGFPDHSVQKLTFTFTPTALGKFDDVLTLQIDNPLVRNKTIRIKGECTDVPLYVDHEEHNMETLVYGHICRQNVVLHNRQAMAMKVFVDFPKPIKAAQDGVQLGCIPSIEFAQGQNNTVVQFTFTPERDFFKKFPQYRDASRPDIKNAFRIPISIRGEDQVLPVNIYLCGTITTNDITFDPPKLEFGKCFTDSSKCMVVSITNQSDLCQQYAFVRLPNFIQVRKCPNDVELENQQVDAEDGDWERPVVEFENQQVDAEDGDWEWSETAVLGGAGTGTSGELLPHETIKLVIVHAPKAAVDMNTSLCLKAAIMANDSAIVRCHSLKMMSRVSFSTRDVIFIQRLLRGRANQTVMFEGKEKRLALINELRVSERWKGADEEYGESNDAVEQFCKKELRDGILKCIEGAIVSQTLDMSSKELVRVQEEKRITVMVKSAERDRRLREASESGRRQAEERFRDQEDEKFRQIMGVHQATADSYFEDALTTSMQQAAKAKALTESKRRATKINTVVHEREERNQSAETVRQTIFVHFHFELDYSSQFYFYVKFHITICLKFCETGLPTAHGPVPLPLRQSPSATIAHQDRGEAIPEGCARYVGRHHQRLQGQVRFSNSKI